MEFIKSSNGQFIKDGKPFKFIGTNMYSIASTDSELSKNLFLDAVDQGFKVIRFWAFAPTKPEKLIELCELAKEHNVYLIPDLADKWGYLQNYKIGNEWYRGDYKKDYLSYVLEIASALKDRPEILLWELINEPENDNFEVFYNFAKDVSEQVKKVNPNHLLSLGTIGGIGDKFGTEFSRFKTSNFKKLYSIPTLDAISLHDYSYNASFFERLDMLYRFKGNLKTANLYGSISHVIDKPFYSLDKYFVNQKNKKVFVPFTMRSIWNSINKKNIRTANELGKPCYFGEVGFKKNAGLDRKKLIELDVREQFARGLSGYILWSFETRGCNNDGHDYGFTKEDNFDELVKRFNNNPP